MFGWGFIVTYRLYLNVRVPVYMSLQSQMVFLFFLIFPLGKGSSVATDLTSITFSHSNSAPNCTWIVHEQCSNVNVVTGKITVNMYPDEILCLWIQVSIYSNVSTWMSALESTMGAPQRVYRGGFLAVSGNKLNNFKSFIQQQTQWYRTPHSPSELSCSPIIRLCACTVSKYY